MVEHVVQSKSEKTIFFVLGDGAGVGGYCFNGTELTKGHNFAKLGPTEKNMCSLIFCTDATYKISSSLLKMFSSFTTNKMHNGLVDVPIAKCLLNFFKVGGIKKIRGVGSMQGEWVMWFVNLRKQMSPQLALLHLKENICAELL